MSRCYLSYQIELKEPLIVSNGSQIGNVLQSHDYIPGSVMLGLCARLYIGDGKIATDAGGAYSEDFRTLFLSDKTLFSPAYPLLDSKRAFPMPMSVFGCKYYGNNEPHDVYRKMHKFRDYLYDPIPDACDVNGCRAPMEHKSGYAYWDEDKEAYFNSSPAKEILTHNQVSEQDEEKRLFSFESLSPGQVFYGEISFVDTRHRELIKALLRKSGEARIGKARNRGYGRIAISPPLEMPAAIREEWSQDIQFSASNKAGFAIFLFSDAILLDRALRHSRFLDKDSLAFWLNLDTPDGLCVHIDPEGERRSFFKGSRVAGFNQHRKMPLPFEQAISRGSVFSITYEGKEDISGKLKTLQADGIGLRRNEGYGMIVVNHNIHEWKPLTSGEVMP